MNVDDLLQRNKLRVETAIKKSSLKFVDFLSDLDNEEEFKFCCPVCLRYFNHMLQSSCCSNYICRLCIGDMAKHAKMQPSYVIRCVHCTTDDFRLEDVDLSGTPREYTDTPAKKRRQKLETFQDAIL